MKKPNKCLKISLIFILIIFLFSACFLIWANDYYKADEEALELYNSLEILEEESNYLIIENDSSSSALIFYPGAKVEYIAYLPILDNISRTCSITCILVKMPFNMAIFNKNAADEIINKYTNITTWYIGGHSMGGAMASSYASEHIEKIQGLILLGAYVYGDYPVSKSLTIYGSYNSNLESKISYTENIVVIEGGNHAQFGNYGKQKGDKEADISASQQQELAVEAIKAFIN